MTLDNKNCAVGAKMYKAELNFHEPCSLMSTGVTSSILEKQLYSYN